MSGDTAYDEMYILDTQEKKANMYINLMKQIMELEGDDGSQFMVGWHHWSVWDYGFASYNTTEVRNFGWFSRKDNAYDGVEATIYGADGILGTWDDEETNFGYFVTPMSQYMNNIYRELQPRQKSNGISGGGFSFK